MRFITDEWGHPVTITGAADLRVRRWIKNPRRAKLVICHPNLNHDLTNYHRADITLQLKEQMIAQIGRPISFRVRPVLRDLMEEWILSMGADEVTRYWQDLISRRPVLDENTDLDYLHEYALESLEAVYGLLFSPQLKLLKPEIVWIERFFCDFVDEFIDFVSRLLEEDPECPRLYLVD